MQYIFLQWHQYVDRLQMMFQFKCVGSAVNVADTFTLILVSNEFLPCKNTSLSVTCMLWTQGHLMQGAYMSFNINKKWMKYWSFNNSSHHEEQYSDLTTLTYLPLVSHIWVSESDQHWFRKWLVAYSVPSHYLNQSWVIVNWTLSNKLQRNLTEIQNFHSQKCIWKYCLQKCYYFVQGRMGWNEAMCSIFCHMSISVANIKFIFIQ